MTDPRRDDLVHDWNLLGQTFQPTKPIEFDDETLRDGLQCPSVRDPSLDAKIEILHLMDKLGIHTADLGLPGAGEKARLHIRTLLEEIGRSKLKIRANVACRTVISDIAPAVDHVQATGVPLEVCTFIGSSPIRQYAEDWDMAVMEQNARAAVRFCRENGVENMFVTEDTTRAHPDHLRRLFTAALEEGTRRLCLCDTCGHATPNGVRQLFAWVREFVAGTGLEVKLDWHGHRDRGLGLANCLAAIESGADRIHATGLGIGERSGNAEMDLLLVNLKLLGWIKNDLRALPDYCRAISNAVGVPIPRSYPVVGADAFETATGVHAAAVIKAFKKGDHWLANRVYSGVPADEVGLEQRITVGPMSGKSNVIWCLERQGIEPTPERVERVLALAKQSSRLLHDDEIAAAARASS
ncbi:MAG: 2-isopropylmalate synthase [Planctomycetes bacterium]|nr:2-isopropylmalate synthase [Planctomycetota bacterium]